MTIEALQLALAQSQNECALLRETNEIVKAQCAELKAAAARQAVLVAQMQRQIEKLLKARFGVGKSEKVNPDELLPFFKDFVDGLVTQGQASEVPPAAPAAAATPAEKPVKPSTSAGRQALPKNLRREVVIHKPEMTDCACPQCQALRVKISEERSEVVAYKAAEVFVIVNAVEVWACPNQKKGLCENTFTAGKKPPQAIEKGLADASLLAQLLVSKYADHIPLYRFEQILLRTNIGISRSTLCDWAMQCGEFLLPLVARFKQLVLNGDVIQSDDTPVDQQDPGGKESNGKGIFKARFFLFRGDGAHPYTVFDYRSNRTADGPLEWFDGTDYRGHFQADGYSGYSPLIKRSQGKIIPAGCLTHARRKFVEASEGVGGDARACEAIAIIGRMYALEKKAKQEADGDPQKRHALQEKLRTAEGRRLWGALGKWAQAMRSPSNPSGIILPKSDLGKALIYLRNQWHHLREPWREGRGHLDVDNNACERDLRGVAVGRKNWLFTGSERGGQVAATLFSLIVSAKRVHPHINLVAYLEWLLREMPKLRDQVSQGKKGWGDYAADERLDEYLPAAWFKKNPPSAVTVADGVVEI